MVLTCLRHDFVLSDLDMRQQSQKGILHCTLERNCLGYVCACCCLWLQSSVPGIFFFVHTYKFTPGMYLLDVKGHVWLAGKL